MDLEEIYGKCGLKNPSLFKKDLLINALFSNDICLTKSIIEGKRQTGKSTDFMMKAIKNMLDGLSTIIWIPSYFTLRTHHHKFLSFFKNFSEESIEVVDNGYFVLASNPKKPFIRFVPLYNNIPQVKILGMKWDIEYDDTDY